MPLLREKELDEIVEQGAQISHALCDHRLLRNCPGEPRQRARC
jgi:hypothetical protein